MRNMESTVHKVPGEHWYKGMLCVDPYFTAASVAEARDFSMRDGDVFLASYCKSGTTWAKKIMPLVLNGADTSKLTNIFDRAPEIGCVGGDSVSGVDLAGPRFLSTYLPLRLMPRECLEKDCKIMYLIRNPKDILVSFYHFYRMDKTLGLFTGKFDEFFDMFLNGQVLSGAWHDHVKSTWDERKDSRILITYYEDLKKDFRGSVERIARFVGKELSPEQIEIIQHQCSFKTMQNNPDDNGTSAPDWDFSKSKFIRKGIVGDWKNHFTVAQNERFDKWYAEKMAGYDIPFQYE